ncbi:MAG: NAD(P)/FAD-dependent oxidoreductase [Pseudomonadota bacterium]
MADNDSALKRIVVVGGGVGGLALVSDLGRSLGRQKRAHITLIDRGPLHVWKPMLHEFAAGTADPHDKGLAFPVQARRNHFAFVPGEMASLDHASRAITIGFPGTFDHRPPQRTVRYDRLVLALGSRANDFGTPGAHQHCHFIDDLRNALEFNEMLRTEVAKQVFTQGPIRVAIVGGGATGVELAAEIRKLIEVGASFGASDLEKQLDVTLIEANSRILKAIDETGAARAAERLKGLGVRIVCNQRVESVDERGFELPGGERIDAALKVWAAGVRAGQLLSDARGLAVNRSGQVQVDAWLRAKDVDGIYALGDCSSLVPDGAEAPLPPTAQVASQQAAYLAKAIMDDIQGKPSEPFHYNDRGSLVSLGAYGSYGSLPKKGFVPSILISGMWASMLHPLFFRIHMFRLLGPILGCVGWLRDGLTSWLRPRIKF